MENAWEYEPLRDCFPQLDGFSVLGNDEATRFNAVARA